MNWNWFSWRMFSIIILFCYHTSYINPFGITFLRNRFYMEISKMSFNIFAKISPTDVFLVELSISLFSKRLANNLFAKSDPSSASINMCLRLDIFNICENVSVFLYTYLFFKGSAQTILVSLSKTTNVYQYPLCFLVHSHSFLKNPRTKYHQKILLLISWFHSSCEVVHYLFYFWKIFLLSFVYCSLEVVTFDFLHWV